MAQSGWLHFLSMNDSRAGVSLLESLRAQSLAARDAASSSRQRTADDLRDIERRLMFAFRWLDEALPCLESIRPAILHRFALGPGLAIAGTRFDRGFASFRRGEFAGHELVLRVELFYRTAGEVPLCFEVPLSAVPAMDERLRAAGLDFDYRVPRRGNRAMLQGEFTVRPAVTASLLLCPDYSRRVVVVTLRNVDRLETVTLEFPPHALTEPALEDLVRLMLGEANGFLRRAPLAGFGAWPGAVVSAAIAPPMPVRPRGVAG
jgi:hypothetical protein